MYYYIFEQPSGSSQKRAQRKIKNLIAETGIAGESVSPSPARTIDELTQIGSSKGYSTVVAVGSDLFINKVASSLLNQVLDGSKKVVLGLVPWQVEKSRLAKIAGIKSVDQAIETLKFRKLNAINPGVVLPNKFFITPLNIKTENPIYFRLTNDDFTTKILATQAAIARGVAIEIINDKWGGSAFKKSFNWLIGKPNVNESKSIFRHNSFLIETDGPIPVALETETIAKTPIKVQGSDKVLHLIVARDKITT